MNKSITMKTALAALACTACVSASAQKQYPEQEKMKPGMSEYWTPQPKVVTPGDIKTNSAASDAIVLFDGKDLSAWQNAKGGPAEWIVKDGVFTVDKKKGDILTKQKFENFQLHIEWCVPENITGTSQGRGRPAASTNKRLLWQMPCASRVNGMSTILSIPLLSSRKTALIVFHRALRSSRTASYCRITRLSWALRNISVSRKS